MTRPGAMRARVWSWLTSMASGTSPTRATNGPTVTLRVAAATRNVTVGPFVARVGLVPDAMLVNQLQTLARIAPGRVIGALGTGDRKSAPEHEIYNLAFQSVADRVGMLRNCCRRLHAV